MARTGRPTFKVTAKLRKTVSELISCGMTHEDIARAIGCTKPTLEKHFKDELKTGAAVKRAESIGLLWKTARKGNVSAQKHLEAMTRVSAVAAPGAAHGSKELGLGKKEQQNRAAGRVEGKFAPPEGPKLVVNNK